MYFKPRPRAAAFFWFFAILAACDLMALLATFALRWSTPWVLLASKLPGTAAWLLHGS
ncbi:MAG: hypothetical protein JSR34_09210 [Proteobacteria bacterium]|nr:hypothetical protein [Pseudomonadota bacterium]